MIPAADTRANLLESALNLFAAYGYDGVGVQQICEAAGVTKPTLYHYFGSKRGLLETLMDARLGALHAALAMAAAPADDLTAALVEVARATFAFARQEPAFYRLYLTLWFAPIESEAYGVAANRHQRHFEMIDALFRAAERRPEDSPGRHRAPAAAFLGMLNNYIGLALNSYAGLNDTLARHSVHEFLHGALAPPEGGDGPNVPIGI
jgi:TetR/AcrR family transcriptional regulator